MERKKVWRTRRRRVRPRIYSQYLDDHPCVSRHSMAMLHARKDIRSLCPPPPKVERSTVVQSLERPLIPPHRSIVQSYFQEDGLHSYHDDGL